MPEVTALILEGFSIQHCEIGVDRPLKKDNYINKGFLQNATLAPASSKRWLGRGFLNRSSGDG